MDPISSLKMLGFELPSPAYMAGAILFGLIGLAAFHYGRKARRTRTLWLGVALMFYPYAVATTWVLYVVGLVLCGLLVVDRQRSRG